ncbi:right-handed parallel beta-helix repeat-containing protein [candidate division KSB1 bacterium]|nr:right-handed parallel beta-helix repeat-containing protein [candidate division KSB1 bacterium]
MKKITILLVVIFLIIANVQATIINVPADRPTIQTAIDSAAAGDTVLVQPDTYVENINFNGKNIVLASLFLTTGETSYISQTIIDGDSSASVVTFESGEDSTAVLTGFTITNGSAGDGGGISCYNSSPVLMNLIITGNLAADGGGIDFNNSSSKLEAVTISDNKAGWVGGGINCGDDSNLRMTDVIITGNTSGLQGGGICCGESSTLQLTDVIITGNTALYGGGIYCEQSNPQFINTTICNNTAILFGGGIYFYDSIADFDADRRCNIYHNTGIFGLDLYAEVLQPIKIVADTFTVKSPTDYHAFPPNKYTFDILSAKVPQVSADLYVSPVGDDTNSGLSELDPLRTMSSALTKILADTLNPLTIHLAEGVYSSSKTGEKFPLGWANFVSLSGLSDTSVVLNAEGEIAVLAFLMDNDIIVENLTISGGQIGTACIGSKMDFKNVIIKENAATGEFEDVGGGFTCEYSRLNLENVKISNNTAAENGGGINSMESSLNLVNVTISDNTSPENGGGIYCKETELTCKNVTISANAATLNGGGLFSEETNLVGEKVTVTGNTAASRGGGMYNRYSDIDMDNCSFTANKALGDFGAAFAFYNEGDPDYADHAYSVKVKNSLFASNNTPGVCAGIYIGKAGGDMSIVNAVIDECELINNSALRNTGMRMTRVNHFDIRNSIFINNKAIQYAAGIEFASYSTGSVSNCLFSHNRGATEGGYYNSGAVSVWSGSNVNFINCTVTDNSAAYGSGLTVGGGGIATATNCIFWGNAFDQIAMDKWNEMGGTLTLNYCDVQGGKNHVNVIDELSVLNWSSGNQNADPLFVDTENNDYHLTDNSPCISAGIDSIRISNNWLIAPFTDIGGNSRPNPAGTIPDIGAYESEIGFAGSNIAAGEVSGFWQANRSPYLVNGEITIPDNQILSIEPGVRIEFTGQYKLNVQGRLLAVGTPEDSITFTAQNRETGWGGISFNQTPSSNDSSKIIYCKLLYGKAAGTWPNQNGGAIRAINFEKLIISHSLITQNSANGADATGGGIWLSNSSPVIKNNFITHNQAPGGGGIICWNSHPLILHNTIGHNHASDGVGGGLTIFNGSHPVLDGNIIANNVAPFGGGVNCYLSSPLMINNLIVDNQSAGGGGGVVCNSEPNAVLIHNTICNNSAADGGGGIICGGRACPVIINTIICGNTAGWNEQIDTWDETSMPCFYYCNIEGGQGKFPGENNMDNDPVFSTHEDSTFCLTHDSPCNGAGTDSVEVDGIWYYAPLTDLAGNPRPNPAGSHPDLGANESRWSSPTGIKETGGEQLPKHFALEQNYPNPFNPVTTIKYSLPRDSDVHLVIYNILGEHVKTLLNTTQSAGVKSVVWDGTNDLNVGVGPGLYLYRLRAETNVFTRKMLLLK